MQADIALLFQNPALSQKAVLEIEPLAPLSIVSTLPGSYYKTQNAPTKYNLCGILENALGWHIGPKDRKAILKAMEKSYKKQFKANPLKKESSEVGYQPLINHLFEVELSVMPAILNRYDDYWKQQMKASDNRHVKGTPNMSWQLFEERRQIDIGDNKGLDYLLKNNPGQFPMYYTSPTPREFIVVEGTYTYKLSISPFLFSRLIEALEENNVAYLGTNEGWVHLSIKEL